MTTRMQIDQLLPGGIRGDDHWHRGRNANICSRCREDVPEDDVPLMLWSQDGNDMLIYCEKCCGVEKMPPIDEDMVP